MMNLGAPEMLLLGILALILFGPRRLPELGKALGEGLAAFRESSRQLSSEFKRQLEEETAPASPTPAPSLPTNVLLGSPMQPLAPPEVEEAASEDDLNEIAAEFERGTAEVLAETEPAPEKATVSA